MADARVVLFRSSFNWSAEAKRCWATLVGVDTLMVTWSEFWCAARFLIQDDIIVKQQAKIRNLLDPLDTGSLNYRPGVDFFVVAVAVVSCYSSYCHVLWPFLVCTGIVKQSVFNAFCCAFGPSFDENALSNAMSLVDEKWFYSYLSISDANNHLAHRKPGTFVVRFALPSMPSDVAIAYSNSDARTVTHLVARLVQQPNGDGAGYSLHVGGRERTFPTVAAIVDALKLDGLLVKPFRSSLISQPYFVGSMSPRAASQALITVRVLCVYGSTNIENKKQSTHENDAKHAA